MIRPLTLALLALLAACNGGSGDADVQPGPMDPEPTIEPQPTHEPEPLMPTADDRDGDGLSNAEEEQGWLLLVDTTGYGAAAQDRLEARMVYGDPDNPDTDGDGLQDGIERAAQSDPGRADTDGDGLTDIDEVRRYATAPNAVDSDGDARGDDGLGAPNPRLFDGAEVALHASPILDDTDADGLSDYQEIIDGGSNPAVSDLPRLNLSIVDAPSVSLNAVEATAMTEGLDEVRTRLRGTQSSQSYSDSRTNEQVFGFRESISNETTVEASFNPLDWSVGASNTTTVELEATQTFSNSATHSTSRESAVNAQDSFQEAVRAEETRSVSYQDGTIRVTLRLTNASDAITVNVRGVTIIAKRFDPSAQRMVTVGELSAVTPIDDNISAGDAIEAVFENTTLSVGDIKAILADPRALTFEIGRYAMRRIGRDGLPTVDYAALSEGLARQCGLVVIDRGDGRVERHSVATNLLRDAMGRPRGVTLGEALTLLGIDDYDTLAAADGRQVLWRLGEEDTALQPAAPGHRFWGVVAPRFDADFDTLRMLPGERITLVHLRDDDGDTLLNREEYIIGTRADDADTDGDGIDDARDLFPLGEPKPDGPEGVPEDGLLAWFPIGVEEGAEDHGPAALPGELRCSVDPVDDRHADFGGALDFANHHPDTRCYARADGIRLPQETTLALWIRSSDTQTSAGFVAGQYGRLSISAQEGYHISARIGPDFRADSIELVWNDDQVNDWVHVAVTVGATNANNRRPFSLYIDGQRVDQATVAASALDAWLPQTPCPDALFFGGAERQCRDGRSEYSGALDDLRVYGRALSVDEIARLVDEQPAEDD